MTNAIGQTLNMCLSRGRRYRVKRIDHPIPPRLHAAGMSWKVKRTADSTDPHFQWGSVLSSSIENYSQ